MAAKDAGQKARDPEKTSALKSFIASQYMSHTYLLANKRSSESFDMAPLNSTFSR
jgi:hypothetical protein